jgi:D-xylose 1-dehydrogenase
MVARYPDLAGRVILVTGGATGIGAAHVRAFAATGARVAFLDVQDEPARALVDAVAAAGGEARFIRCDLLDLDALREAVDRAARELGPIHGLVNNAAVDQRGGLEEVTPADFAWMMDVNLRHVVFASQHVAEGMKRARCGAIVTTSSVAYLRGVADLPLYSAAKAAIVGFTNALARSLGPYGIRVNAVVPGNVPTPRQEALWATDEATRRELLARQCIPEPVRPEDVANAAVFLCSDAARMITKHSLVVNAGSL